LILAEAARISTIAACLMATDIWRSLTAVPV